jgi:hypothetical protein
MYPGTHTVLILHSCTVRILILYLYPPRIILHSWQVRRHLTLFRGEARRKGGHWANEGSWGGEAGRGRAAGGRSWAREGSWARTGSRLRVHGKINRELQQKALTEMEGSACFSFAEMRQCRTANSGEAQRYTSWFWGGTAVLCAAGPQGEGRRTRRRLATACAASAAGQNPQPLVRPEFNSEDAEARFHKKV